MKINRILTILLLAAMTLAVFSYAADTGRIPKFDEDKTSANNASADRFSLTAVHSDWAADELMRAGGEGLILVDIGDDLTQPITRLLFCEELAVMLDRLGKLPEADAPNPPIFTDVQNGSIDRLYMIGVVKGVSDTEFAPERLITREEAAVFLSRTASYLKTGIPEIADDYPYTDYDDISEWAIDDVRDMFAAGIMVGVGGGRFSPAENYTKEQAVITILRMRDYYQNAKSHETAAGSLSKRIAAEMGDGGNWCVSPFSIRCALALAANGAAGDTKSQILAAAGITNLEAFNKSAEGLISLYEGGKSITLEIADSLWINTSRSEGIRFSDAYVSLVGKYFGATSETVEDTDAVERVNAWTAEKTHDKIKEIISDPDFAALLANAVYFKGAWADQFSTYDTTKADFIEADGTKKQIYFMNRTGDYNVYIGDDYKAIELPFTNTYNGANFSLESEDGKSVSMFILIGGYGDVEDAVANTVFKSKKVELSIPKFRIESSLNMTGALKKWGMTDAFNEKKADFAPMFDSGNMYVSDVLHKTYIDVAETGAEAAAVTAVIMKVTSFIPSEESETVVFKADEPFTYVLRENNSGEILFVGQYNKAQ